MTYALLHPRHPFIAGFAACCLALLAVPAQGQDATLIVPYEWGVRNGEVHQLRVRCAICEGRCRDATSGVATGEYIQNYGGLGNHGGGSGTYTVPLTVGRGMHVCDGTDYLCTFELRHYQTPTGTFVPPIREGNGGPEDRWRTASSSAPFRSTVAGPLSGKPWKEVITTGTLQMTGFPREE